MTWTTVSATSWPDYAAAHGGRFVPGGSFSSPQLELPCGAWILRFDFFRLNNDSLVSQRYTRVRAAFVAARGFWFQIALANVWRSLGRRFGWATTQMGRPEFDDRFTLRTNDVDQLRRFLDDETQRRIQWAVAGELWIQDHEGWWGPYYPRGVDVLCLQHPALIDDPARLDVICHLFGEVLDRLVEVGAATRDDPHDLIEARPRWLAVPLGLFGGLILGVVGCGPLCLLLMLAIGVRSSEWPLGVIVGGLIGVFLLVPAGGMTSLLFLMSQGRRFGHLFGSGRLRSGGPP